jgi:toxin ParE1/3/4
VKLRFLPGVRDELREAAEYYNRSRQGLGREYTSEIRQKLKQALAAPERFAVKRSQGLREQIRSALIWRFPYEIIFFVENDELIVVAIAHAKRRPGYWKKRLK